MFLEILTVTLVVSSCVGSPVNQNDGTVVKPFVCESGLVAPVRKKEDISPSSDIAMRSFLLNQDEKWHAAFVPYVIDRAFSEKQVAMIQEEMQKIASVSCVRWKPRQNQRDYVSFQLSEQPGQCASHVGRVGGVQEVLLGSDCFEVDKGYRGALVHEMMHALGFIHEQQRLDRDCYVQVVNSAVETKPGDYAIRPNTSLDFPYDFGSIMHYGTSAVMKSQKGVRMGNFQGKFTEIDVLKLNFMYCKGKSFCELRPADCNKFKQAEQSCLLT